MNLKDARELRDRIRATGIWSVVPLGHGPDGYFAQIWTCRESVGRGAQPKRFASFAEWDAWKYAADKEDSRRAWELEHRSRPRSPIEMMIDQACGLDANGKLAGAAS